MPEGNARILTDKRPASNDARLWPPECAASPRCLTKSAGGVAQVRCAGPMSRPGSASRRPSAHGTGSRKARNASTARWLGPRGTVDPRPRPERLGAGPAQSRAAAASGPRRVLAARPRLTSVPPGSPRPGVDVHRRLRVSPPPAPASARARAAQERAKVPIRERPSHRGRLIRSDPDARSAASRCLASARARARVDNGPTNTPRRTPAASRPGRKRGNLRHAGDGYGIETREDAAERPGSKIRAQHPAPSASIGQHRDRDGRSRHPRSTLRSAAAVQETKPTPGDALLRGSRAASDCLAGDSMARAFSRPRVLSRALRVTLDGPRTRSRGGIMRSIAHADKTEDI